MSRAFVKEPDTPPADDVIERPQSGHPNYVTAQGLELLQARCHALAAQRAALAERGDDPMSQQQLAGVERDLLYWQGRLERAVVVDLAQQPSDEVHFGAVVEVRGEGGRLQHFTIVGEDEADGAAGKVSWVSPLARAMLGARVGEVVTWQRPAGNIELEIAAIRYPSAR